MTCSQTLRLQGKPYPRTCAEHGLHCPTPPDEEAKIFEDALFSDYYITEMRRELRGMTRSYIQIRQFMEKAGQAMPTEPTIPSPEIRLLRAKLMLEEVLETVHALGIDVETGNGVVIGTGLQFYVNQYRQPDMVGVADGCADVEVVTKGTLIAFGLKDEALQHAVNESNLAKFGPGGYCAGPNDPKGPEGKWIKPPDWEAPDLGAIIEAQRR